MPLQQAEAYITNQQSRFLKELDQFLRIPSISTDQKHAADVEACANHLTQLLTDAGLEQAAVHHTAGHPIVYADWLHAPGKPTILLYGHYDVQPPDPLHEWHTPPFEPAVRDGYIYARGASDDKGQLFCHIKSIEALLKTIGKLPINIKIICEGEEESGSSHLADFLVENKERLTANVALISDTAMYDITTPTICFSLRGLAYLEITVTSAKGDLHSGEYGGTAPNPINILAHMIAKLKDETGKIKIPHFYDKVLEPEKNLRQTLRTIPFDDQQYMHSIGVTALHGEAEYEPLERIWFRPTLDVNGIIGGFTGRGAKTVIPATASAKISMRLVPRQDPQQILELTAAYLKELTPEGITVTIIYHGTGQPVVVDTSHPGIDAAFHALEAVHGRSPILMGEGGSIPVVADIKKILGLETVLLGFGLPNDNLHAPNERFRLQNFFDGIRTSMHFFTAFGQ